MLQKQLVTSLKGYRKWKKATIKDIAFCSHAISEGHANAMFAKKYGYKYLNLWTNRWAKN